jgi:hypothetical protein
MKDFNRYGFNAVTMKFLFVRSKLKRSPYSRLFLIY